MSKALRVEFLSFELAAGLCSARSVAPVQQRFWPDAQPLVERLGQTFFRQVPTGPGVYLMHGPRDSVLYVGKAKNLRHRLGSYRVANPERMPRRTLRLLRLVERIVWEECPDEPSALRRESELLLCLKPRFNRAGVWPAPKRFLIWRALGNDLELGLTLQPEPEQGWRSLGPFGGVARALFPALVRLLWFQAYPEAGLAGMPVGWFRGPQDGLVLIPKAEGTLLKPLFAGLSGLPESVESDLAQVPGWQTPARPFERVLWQEDLVLVRQFLGP